MQFSLERMSEYRTNVIRNVSFETIGEIVRISWRQYVSEGIGDEMKIWRNFNLVVRKRQLVAFADFLLEATLVEYIDDVNRKIRQLRYS